MAGVSRLQQGEMVRDNIFNNRTMLLVLSLNQQTP